MKYGLKNLSQLAKEPDASEDIKSRAAYNSTRSYFTNDPSFIYTRPVWNGPGSTKIAVGKSIVLAARPESVQMFNMNWKDMALSDSSNSNWYRGSWFDHSLPYTEFVERSANLRPGQALDQRGNAVDISTLSDYMLIYDPETLINADNIDPEWIVPHEIIPETLKREW
ncbi:hypothetical protein V866_006021 [Kwoniella sp. B9012]